jgi:hypothetical protein
MLTPNTNTKYKCSNENLPGMPLQGVYVFALPFPTTFPFYSFLKIWLSNVQAGFNTLSLQAVHTIVYPQKTMTA